MRMSPPVWFGCFLLLSLSACSLLPARPPTPALHDFGPATVQTREKAAWSAVSVDAPEWLQSENIRYRLLYAEPTRVRYYAQDRWLAAPSALLAQRLSLSQGAGGVRLKIKLLEFEQIFDNPQQARVTLAFQATAMPPDSEGILGQKIFKFDQTTPSADAKGAVTGLSELVRKADNALETWLSEIAHR
jgi:cholesterol transport system auxiliary component